MSQKSFHNSDNSNSYTKDIPEWLLYKLYDKSEMYLFDANTFQLLLVNNRAISNLGYSKEQLLKMTSLDIKPEITEFAFKELLQPLLIHEKTEIKFETVHQRMDGSRYPVEIQLQLVDDQEPPVFLAIETDITNRIQQKEEDRLKDELLQLTGKMTKVGGWEFDVATLNGTWSEEVARIHDLDPDQETNVQLGISFYVDDSRAKIEKAIKEAIDLEKPYDLELEMVTAKGIQKTVRTLGIPIIEDGKVIKIRGIFQDITERKLAEVKIRENESRLEQAQNIAHIGNWEIVLGENVMWASREAFRIYGLEEMYPNITLQIAQQIPLEEYRPIMDSALDSLIKKGEEYDLEFQIRRVNDGAVRDIHSLANLEFNAEGQPVKAVGVIQDITEQNKAKQDLSNSETRFRTLFEHAAVGVSLIDTKTGKYLDINQKYCNFLGYTKEEMQGFTIHDVSYPADLQENLEKNQLFLAGKIREFTIEKRYIHKDGRIVWGELTASPLWLPGEKSPEFMHIAVVQDITERKQTEEKIQSQLDELRRWHNITLNREIRILELKAEINDLLTKAGYPPRYESPEQEPGS